ncbi:MAG: hypothetical protein ABIQ39_15125 [Ilumatobacteraceae bacterium]
MLVDVLDVLVVGLMVVEVLDVLDVVLDASVTGTDGVLDADLAPLLQAVASSAIVIVAAPRRANRDR